MSYKKQILLVCLILSLLFILTSQAQAVPQWLRNLRIAITPQRPVSYHGTNAEFQANPTYIQADQDDGRGHFLIGNVLRITYSLLVGTGR